jgi:hypothetical protein
MTVQHTTDAEIVLALRAVEKHGSVRAAARHLGVDASTIKRRVAAGAKRGITAASQVITDEDRLRMKVSEQASEIKRLGGALDGAMTDMKTIAGLLERPPQPPTWVSPPRPAATSGFASEIPVLQISDIHYGERVFLEEMAGVNEFDRTIGEQRLRQLFESACLLIERDLHGKKPRGVVVTFGGDMITGDIHEELEITNDGYTTQAVDDLTDILCAGLTTLADKYGRIFVPCVVGNHGRNTKKKRAKGMVYTSYEWLMYRTIVRHFRNDKRITFLVPGEVDAYFKINGKRFLLSHGDRLGVKGGDGIIGAIGPIMRGTVKVGTSEAQIGRDFDYLMIGHYHYPLYLPHTIVNGCVKGYDEYARVELRVPYAPASQMLFYVHPVHGLTIRREILLQEPVARTRLASDEAWVALQAA